MDAMVDSVTISHFPFPELTSCHLLYSGYGNEDYHWNVIKKDNTAYFHKVFTRNAYYRGLQEIDSYFKYCGNKGFTHMFNVYNKYATNEQLQQCEILQQYAGLPLSFLRSITKFNVHIVHYLINILRACATLLSVNKFTFHGNIEPSNIFYNVESNICSFQCGYNIYYGPEKLLSHKYLFANPYFCAPEVLRYGYTNNPYKADIYSLGLTFLDLILNPSGKGGYYHSTICSLPLMLRVSDHTQFLNEIKKMLPSSVESQKVFSFTKLLEVLFNMIDEDPTKRLEPAAIQKSLQDCFGNAKCKEEEDSIPPTAMKMDDIFAKYGKIHRIQFFMSSPTSICYSIIVKNKNWLLKKCGNLEEIKNEMEIIKKISMIMDERIMLPSILQYNLDTCPYEILLDFNGTDLLTQSSLNKPNNAEVLLIIQVMIAIIHFLTNANLYHGYIRPESILIDCEHKKIMLLNFQYSLIDADINRESAIMMLPGVDKNMLYSPPEVVSGTTHPYYIPRKVDIYCLASTALAFLHRFYSFSNMATKFYFKSPDECSQLIEITKEFGKDATNFNQYILHEHTNFTNKVMNMKSSYPAQDIIRCFTNLLSDMLSTNPMMRPHSSVIEEKLVSLVKQIQTQKIDGSIEQATIKYNAPLLFDKNDEPTVFMPKCLLKLSLSENCQKISPAEIIEYDYELKKTLKKYKLRIPTLCDIICCYDNKINEPVLYFIANPDESFNPNNLYRFDKIKLKLDTLNSLNECRVKYVYESWNDTIVVGGGHHPRTNNPLGSLEIYKVSRNKWSRIEAKSSINALCRAQGKLYAIGLKDIADSSMKTSPIRADLLNLTTYEWEESISVQIDTIHNWGPFTISVDYKEKIYILSKVQDSKSNKSYCFNLAKKCIDPITFKSWSELGNKSIIWMKYGNGDIWAVPKGNLHEDSVAYKIDMKEKKVDTIALI